MIIDTITQFVKSILDASAAIVTPDWGQLIGLLPILLLIGVVGPIVTILALVWLRYGAKRPGVRTRFADSRRPAPLDAAGNPVYPTGEPFSPSEHLVYEPGATRSATGETLMVACPKCSLVRPAENDTCGNCGLSFTLKPTTRSLRASGPKPGGAAAA